MPLKIAQAPVIRVRPRKSGNWVVKGVAILIKTARVMVTALAVAVGVALAAVTWAGLGAKWGVRRLLVFQGRRPFVICHHFDQHYFK